MQVLDKKSILKKTVQIGGSTLLSRALGLIRETLLGRYLVIGSAVADSFATAFKIPNSLRKIFAEGALSASFIPTITSLIKKNEHKEANSLMSASFLVFEGCLLFICFLVFLFPQYVIWITSPGFSIDQIKLTSPFLKIMIFFILFLSSSSLLTGALQAVHHFTVPAFASVLLNIVFIAAALLGIWFNLPINFLCYSILIGGLLSFLLHLYVYFELGFNFGKINSKSWHDLKILLKRFFPIFFSMSVVEISLFLDTGFASYLPTGSISLIYFAHRFMGIPLGVFATSFSTVLLPHFSRISLYAPKRLSFYLLESTKFIFWVTIPATILMTFFADKVFITLFLSKSFTMASVMEAKNILIAFLVALFFLSLNKILLNIFYSLGDSSIPTVVSIFALGVNFVMNWIFLSPFGTVGLAAATTISSIVQTFMMTAFLITKYKFTFYPSYLFKFIYKYLAQLALMFSLFFVVYKLCVLLIENYFAPFSHFLLMTIGFWLWVWTTLFIAVSSFIQNQKNVWTKNVLFRIKKAPNFGALNLTYKLFQISVDLCSFFRFCCIFWIC